MRSIYKIVWYIILWFVGCPCALAQVTLLVDQVPSNTPAGSALFVAGNFNGWDPAGSPMTALPQGKWGYTVPAGTGTLEFKFTRGSWASVEGNAQGGMRPNRSHVYGNGDTLLLQILSWEGTSNSGSTANQQVQILDEQFWMPQLGRFRRIWIYLPVSYPHSTRRYPVLYLQDGQNIFDATTSFSGEWKVDETLTELEQAGDSGVIVVAIDHGGSDRIDEYSIWVNDQYGGGDGEAYLEFVVQTIKPHIDSSFRTLPDRGHTAIMGSSMGGLMALSGLLKYPEIFSRAGVFSPSLWFSDSIYHLASNAVYLPDSRVYFLAGGQEPASVAQNCLRMADSLLVIGYLPAEIQTRVLSDGAHSEWFWEREFGDAYQFLFASQATTTTSSKAPTSLFESVKAYPNPGWDSITFDTPTPLMVSLYTADGRLLLKERLPAGNQSMGLPPLPKGVYLLQLQSGAEQKNLRWVKY